MTRTQKFHNRCKIDQWKAIYTKLGYVAPIRFRVIGKKPHGGGGKMTPPPTRAKVKYRTANLFYVALRSNIGSGPESSQHSACSSFYLVCTGRPTWERSFPSVDSLPGEPSFGLPTTVVELPPCRLDAIPDNTEDIAFSQSRYLCHIGRGSYHPIT